MKAIKSNHNFSSRCHGFRYFILTIATALFMSGPVGWGQGQQTTNTNLKSLNKPQQPIRKFNIPGNLFQIQLVSVPNLVGRKYNRDEINALLEKARLRLGKEIPEENNEMAGIIISQSLQFQQRVMPQTAIDISYGVNSRPTTPEISPIVRIPNYIGQNIDEVLRKLPNDSLRAGQYSEVTSDQPAGIVTEQFPPPGTTVDLFTNVSFKFSTGPRQQINVKVPRLIGLSLQEAAEILKHHKLYAGSITEQLSEKEEGIILDQDPSEETLVPIETAINLVYSVKVKEPRIIVPDVIGMPTENALKTLENAGLTDTRIYFEDSDSEDGTIIRQDPVANDKVLKGTIVILIAARHAPIPSVWAYLAGGILTALGLSIFWRWKLQRANRQRKNKTGNSEILQLTIILDSGKQTFHPYDARGLQLKIIPDEGVQTLKTN